MIKKYEHYKDSGVEWLGEIPEHWEVVRLKNVIRLGITDGPHETPEFIENGVPFLSVDSIQNGELVFDKCRFISEEDHLKYKKKCFVEKNDILMGKAASIGKIAQSKVDFEYSIWSPLALIKPSKEKIISTYLEFYLKSSYSQYQIEILCTSNTQKNISMGDIPKIQISLPPLPEQTAIANFLDDKTVKIDQAIGIKKQQIALLKERKQILIHKAVTRGLDDSVPLKDSGVEWIGEIPEHWEVKALKFICDLQSGDFISSEDFKQEGFPIYGGNGFRGYAENFTNEGFYALIGRQGALCGNVNYANGKFYATEHAVVVYPLNNEDTLWLGETITVADFNRLSQSAAQPGIAVGVIKNERFPYPPLSEQKEISEYIETASQKIETAISMKQQEIEKLKEYKSSLINSVVTGKVKIIEN